MLQMARPVLSKRRIIHVYIYICIYMCIHVNTKPHTTLPNGPCLSGLRSIGRAEDLVGELIGTQDWSGEPRI